MYQCFPAWRCQTAIGCSSRNRFNNQSTQFWRYMLPTSYWSRSVSNGRSWELSEEKRMCQNLKNRKRIMFIYFFVHSNSKTNCLICNVSVDLPNNGNSEWHFNALYRQVSKNKMQCGECQKWRSNWRRTLTHVCFSVKFDENGYGGCGTVMC